MRRFFLLLLAFFLPCLVMGCASKQFWSASPAKGGGVQVEPMQAWVGGHKLWVRTTVLNGTPETIRVVRDAVSCTLPDGRRIGRASGSSTVHTPYVIPAGGSHAVYVEFEEENFVWRDIPKVSIDFSKAITKNEQTVAIAPMVITNADEEK